MSKSAGNFFTVRDIVARFPYEVIRFFILNGHYRMPINFSDELMQSCQNGLERIKNCKSNLLYYIENAKNKDMTEDEKKQLETLDNFRVQFEKAMDDDFNTADAITAIYELVRFINKSVTDEVSVEFANKELEMFNKLTSVLGLLEKADEKAEDEDTALIEELIAKRTEAKKNKDFATADAIRDELSAMGITIKDTRQGVQWFRG